MRAYVPDFAARLKAGDVSGADAVLARMRKLSAHNADARPLVAELDWIGRLERFTAQRGADAPIRLYTDEVPIRQLLAYWNQDTTAHQRALGRIAADVPAFRDRYADALSDVRRLQNDASVYLAAIDRLNATIAAELGRDRPEALPPVIAEYREKYPRLAGLDRVQSDLDRYTALMQALRTRRPGPLVARLADSRFATPPFQAQFNNLAARLPRRRWCASYASAAKAWQQGDSAAALAGIKQISGGWPTTWRATCRTSRRWRRSTPSCSPRAAVRVMRTGCWASTPCSMPTKTAISPRRSRPTSTACATVPCGAPGN